MNISKFEKLDRSVQNDIRDYVTGSGLSSSEKFPEWVQKSSPREILGAYLYWTGLTGWVEEIFGLVEILLEKDD